MFLFLLAIACGCLGLYFGGDLLLKGATVVGRLLGWSAAVIGFVLISLGTSAPELFVSAGAALQGYGDVAAGNVVGSNIVNIAIVLGLGALIMPLAINRAIRVHQLPLMLGLTVMGFGFLVDGHLGRIAGAFLLSGAVGSVWWVMRVDGVPDLEEALGEEVRQAEPHSIWPSLFFITAGVLLLLLGAQSLIWGGVGLATYFGVPDAVVALTVTSIGTGLPEITATVMAVIRRDTDMAVGNVVGSNMLNIGLVLGFSGLVSPINSRGVDMLPLSIMLLLSFLVLLLAWRPGHVGRWVGGSLLAAFAAYTVLLVQ
ncbi:calcium/sodium antiporter [Granulosicoccus sp. 3-233]|uniref:calcium/sodium antiporter n=1 Tax=Granulosicoccus sp. 3-233 TaxID=3417969 RepID=UPI003D34F97B